MSEKTFNVTLSESELTLIVGSLWHQEHEQLRLAGVAAKEGNTRQEQARRDSAVRALELADRLADIGSRT